VEAECKFSWIFVSAVSYWSKDTDWTFGFQ